MIRCGSKTPERNGGGTSCGSKTVAVEAEAAEAAGDAAAAAVASGVAALR